MTRFIKKILIFCGFPVFLLTFIIILYYIADPYSDFGKKENYSWKYHFQQLGDISTKKLINSTLDYNSFVLGSSRAVGIYACYLEKEIPDSKFFHYANWGETIGGMHSKLKLVDSLGMSINNVIIYIDTDYTFKDDGKCKPSDHYLLTKTSKICYYLSHFKAFYQNLSFDKLKIIFGLKVSSKEFRNWQSDKRTNDPQHQCNNPSILENYSNSIDNEYDKHRIDSLKRLGFFYQRPSIQKYKEPQISKYEKYVLLQIRKILERHNTDYYIVITPLYDQYKFNTGDKKILDEIFKDRIYDFSGINEITENIYNYPDRKHFKPYISKNILDSIINKQDKNY